MTTSLPTTTVNPFQKSSFKIHIPPRSQQPHDPQILELAIFTRNVALYTEPPPLINTDTLAQSAMSTTDPPDDHGFTHVLSGPLADFEHYSRHEHSQWLIDIAHDICDPLHKRGTLQVWEEAEGAFRDVIPDEPLIASFYAYLVLGVVALTKISARTGRTRTGTTGNASTMASRVAARDGRRCWVTRHYLRNRNSHVCPRRMGDHLLRQIYETFVGTPPPPTLSVYDEICGISLNHFIDDLFDTYDLGLRFVAVNQYECHFFPPPDLEPDCECTTFGFDMPDVTAPPLHGHTASPPNPDVENNTPSGLFRWHYLQCVIRKFAHTDYRNMQYINYSELPLRMEDDSDDGEPDWPSAPLDYGRAMQAMIEEFKEQQRAVAEWVTAL